MSCLYDNQESYNNAHQEKQQTNLISNQGVRNSILNHGVRKIWIYWTLHLLTLWNYMEHLGNFDYFLDLCILDGPLTNFTTNFHEISIISSNKGGNRWTIDKISGFYGIFQIFPETQAMLTQRQRRFIL